MFAILSQGDKKRGDTIRLFEINLAISPFFSYKKLTLSIMLGKPSILKHCRCILLV